MRLFGRMGSNLVPPDLDKTRNLILAFNIGTHSAPGLITLQSCTVLSLTENNTNSCFNCAQADRGRRKLFPAAAKSRNNNRSKQRSMRLEARWHLSNSRRFVCKRPLNSRDHYLCLGAFAALGFQIVTSMATCSQVSYSFLRATSSTIEHRLHNNARNDRHCITTPRPLASRRRAQ